MKRCAHHHLTVLDSHGSNYDDHESQFVQCNKCHELFVATIWKLDRPTELRRVSAAESVRYGALVS